MALLQVLDSRQSWVIPLQGGFEIGYSGSQLMPVCIFASLPARYTTTVIEVVRPPCAGGMQWNILAYSRPEQHQVVLGTAAPLSLTGKQRWPALVEKWS